MKKGIDLILFDLDGTIYNGNQLIDGALETIGFFKKLNKKICFLTNNSGSTRIQIFEKLKGFSIDLIDTDVYNCSYAAGKYLTEKAYNNIHVIGSDNLIEEVSNININIINSVSEKINIDAILIGLDKAFDYTKLANAYEILQTNPYCKIIICNMDYDFPIENGLKKPGCGAIAASILSISNKKIDFMIGKPNTYILDLIQKEKNISIENMLIIGDSIESDIQMAKNANTHSILISNSQKTNSPKTITTKSIKKIQEIFYDYFT